MLSDRSLVMASEGVKPSPPAITRSAPAATTFSVSTAENVATSGRATASAGKSLLSSVATTRSPAPSANRISVVAGVSEPSVPGGRRDRDGRALVVGQRRG